MGGYMRMQKKRRQRRPRQGAARPATEAWNELQRARARAARPPAEDGWSGPEGTFWTPPTRPPLWPLLVGLAVLLALLASCVPTQPIDVGVMGAALMMIAGGLLLLRDVFPHPPREHPAPDDETPCKVGRRCWCRTPLGQEVVRLTTPQHVVEARRRSRRI